MQLSPLNPRLTKTARVAARTLLSMFTKEILGAMTHLIVFNISGLVMAEYHNRQVPDMIKGFRWPPPDADVDGQMAGGESA